LKYFKKQNLIINDEWYSSLIAFDGKSYYELGLGDFSELYLMARESSLSPDKYVKKLISSKNLSVFDGDIDESLKAYEKLIESRYLDFPNFKETWMQSGDTPKKGEIFKNLDLARTLEEISKTKRKSFYEGRLAKEIARFIKDQGGFLSFEDMSNYQSEWVEPVSSNYRGYDVWELPPNGQGIAALQILNILEGYDLKAMGLNSAEYVHHFVEAKKIAFADRAKYYADPKFNNIDIEYLISKEYAELRRKEINS